MRIISIISFFIFLLFISVAPPLDGIARAQPPAPGAVRPEDVNYTALLLQFLKQNPDISHDAATLRYWAQYRFRQEFNQVQNQDFRLQSLLGKAQADLDEALAATPAGKVALVGVVAVGPYDFSTQTFPVPLTVRTVLNAPVCCIKVGFPTSMTIDIDDIALIQHLPMSKEAAQAFLDKRTRAGNVDRRLYPAITVDLGNSKVGSASVHAQLVQATFYADEARHEPLVDMTHADLDRLREERDRADKQAQEAEAEKRRNVPQAVSVAKATPAEIKPAAAQPSGPPTKNSGPAVDWVGLLVFGAVAVVIYRKFLAGRLNGGGRNRKLGEGKASSGWAGQRDLAAIDSTQVESNLFMGAGAGIVLGNFGAGDRAPLLVSAGMGRRFEHVLLCSPPGGGKGQGVILPTLLTYQGSMVVLDPKGENAMKCARTLRARGTEVLVIDPWDVTRLGSQAINPLAGLSLDDDDLLDDLRGIAASLISGENSGGKDSGNSQYFIDNAVMAVVALLVSVIAFAKPGENQDNLNSLFELSKLGADDRKLVSTTMLGHEDKIVQSAGATLERIFELREFSTVWSYVVKSLTLLESPRIQRSLGATTFSPLDIRDRPVAVFLVLPGDKMGSHGRILKTWLDAISRPLMKAGEYPQDRIPILFMLDEVFSRDLGKIETLETQLTLFRSVGIRTCLVTQTLAQMESLYGDTGRGVFMGATGVKIFFAINDNDTAKEVSEMLGKRELAVQNTSISKGKKLFEANTVTHSHSIETRNLLEPNEIIQLPKSAGIVIKQGLPPIMMRRIEAYKDAPFNGLMA